MRGYYDVFLLIGDIKGLTFKFDRHNHPLHALHKANRYFQRYYQTVHTKNPQYLETLKNKVLVIESYGRAIGTYPGLSKEELTVAANPTDPQKKAADESAKIKYIGVVILC